jgi:hypothetical protein
MMGTLTVRETFVLLLLLLPGLAVANALVFGGELRRFLREVPSLSSTRDVERYKTVVAHQMYAALAQIGLLGAPILLFFVGVARGVLGPGDVLLIILPSLVVIVVAAQLKKVETQARQIPAADDELATQRDVIVATWIKKPLPDW